MQPCMGCSCYKLKQPAAVCKHADADYQAFFKQLEEGPELLPSAAIQREQQEKAAASRSPDDVAAASAIKVTPIMEYLRNKYLNNPGLRPGRKGGRHTAKEAEVSTIPDMAIWSMLCINSHQTSSSPPSMLPPNSTQSVHQSVFSSADEFKAAHGA